MTGSTRELAAVAAVALAPVACFCAAVRVRLYFWRNWLSFWAKASWLISPSWAWTQASVRAIFSFAYSESSICWSGAVTPLPVQLPSMPP
ncbi:hypothetical protein [Streptomyces sp. NPDC055632]